MASHYFTLHRFLVTGFNADFIKWLFICRCNESLHGTMACPFITSNGEVIKPTQIWLSVYYYLTLMINNNKSILKKWFTNEKKLY
jgi:hypothetical protein